MIKNQIIEALNTYVEALEGTDDERKINSIIKAMKHGIENLEYTIE